jgi:hypothetical protein
MPVAIGGTTYGCSAALEKRGYGIRRAGQALSETLRSGGTLPSVYVIAGETFNVVKIDISPNGTSDNQTAYSGAVSASRGGTPTLLVLPPSSTHYRYSNTVTLSADTYLVGYGATIEPLGLEDYAHIMGGNRAGVFGLRMLGASGALSKWPERFEDNPSGEPSKDGVVSKNNGGGVTNDAWVVASRRDDIIVMDNIAYGSLTGFVRVWGGASNHLYEGNVMRRSHSDSIHLTYNSTYMTARRNRIFDSGDDAISVVSYDKTSGAAPGNILVELNEVNGGRARGLTVVGGLDVLHQDNTVEYTNLAPFLYAAASSHNTHSVRAICRRNKILRGGQRTANHVHNGIAVATFSYGSETVVIDVTDNEAWTYGEKYAGGGDFVRTATGVTATESGNAVTAIDSAD